MPLLSLSCFVDLLVELSLGDAQFVDFFSSPTETGHVAAYLERACVEPRVGESLE